MEIMEEDVDVLVVIDGVELPLTGYPRSAVAGTVRGLISSLRGAEALDEGPPRRIRIEIETQLGDRS